MAGLCKFIRASALVSRAYTHTHKHNVMKNGIVARIEGTTKSTWDEVLVESVAQNLSQNKRIGHIVQKLKMKSELLIYCPESDWTDEPWNHTLSDRNQCDLETLFLRAIQSSKPPTIQIKRPIYSVERAHYTEYCFIFDGLFTIYHLVFDSNFEFNASNRIVTFRKYLYSQFLGRFLMCCTWR